MTAAITITVDEDAVIRAIRETVSDMGRFIELVADDLADTIAQEASGASARLGAPWKVEGLGTDRTVSAPEWWAHFLARGTADHGPAGASFMTFEVAGEMVFARHVSGIPADPFDERAMVKTRGHLDEILRRVIAT